jgi:hypothetical protein
LKVRAKEFEIPLTDEFSIAVEIKSLAGEITAFVVRLMKSGEEPTNLARYDTAHGVPHRDVLGQRGGLLRKDWLTGTPLKNALEYAINDFKTNYERYDRIHETN